MPSDTGLALKRLGLALLNATLLLAVIALALAVTLVVQLRGLAGDMRDGVRSELVAMQPRVEAARSSARAALDALEPAADGAVDAPARAAAREDLRALIDRLEALEPGPQTRAETESLLQRLVMAVLATAARTLLLEPPPD